jgi:hypothetical protein
MSFLIGALQRGSWTLRPRGCNRAVVFLPFSVAAARKRTDFKLLLRPRQGALHFFLLSKERKSHKGGIATAMVYVDSWDTFVERSISLFRADPVAVSCFNLLTFKVFLFCMCVFFFVQILVSFWGLRVRWDSLEERLQ